MLRNGLFFRRSHDWLMANGSASIERIQQRVSLFLTTTRLCGIDLLAVPSRKSVLESLRARESDAAIIVVPSPEAVSTGAEFLDLAIRIQQKQ